MLESIFFEVPPCSNEPRPDEGHGGARPAAADSRKSFQGRFIMSK